MFTKTLFYFLCLSAAVLSTSPPHVCGPGKFGHDCFYDCNCVDNKCNLFGSCVGTECKNGWSGPTCQRRNIALHSNVTQSPYETMSADNVIDGNSSTYSETFGSPPYLYVDYGREAKIDVLKVTYVNRPSMKVCYTDDLKKFENKNELYSMSHNCYTSYTSPQTYRMTKNARYIVIFPKVKKPTALMVNEIEAKENYLSHGKTDMKPTPSKRHPSRFATDGNRYTYAESTGNDTAWIVKLGAFYNIKTVELKFRHISSKMTYELHISNSTDIYDGKTDNSSKKYSITLKRYITKQWNVNMNPPVAGRYITFLKKGKGLLKLYEIKALETLKPVAAKQTPYEFHYKASLAVDGMTSTFSQTLGKKPYFSVDLGKVTEISSYSVDFALKDNDYELCVSSNNRDLYTGGNTKAIPSDTCWNTTRLNTTWEIQRHGSGRYVSLTSPGEGFLTLKELQIYVCSKGTYGYNCSKQCTNCKDHDCGSLIGNCLQGCAYGLTGKSCSDECPYTCICNGSATECDFCRGGWFGAVCDQPCPSRCSQSCNKTTGICLNCSPGFFGTDCNNYCSKACDNQTGCDKITGVCLSCQSQYLYGKACKTKCPQYCDTSLGCKRDTGECYECKAGFRGKACDIPCSSNCNELGCDIDTGFCYGCKLGYASAKCMTVCNTSQDECIECTKDARSCSFNCSENCYNNNCNNTSGDCLSCNKGFYGDVCDKKCSAGCDEPSCFQNGTCLKCKNGFYGTKCFKKCSENCNGKGCLKTTGDCNECKIGYFGKFCTDKCPNNCGNEGCNMDTKFCLTCKTGYYGSSCNKSCPSQCDKQGCEISSGHCYRCKTGFYGNTCTDMCSSNCNFEGCTMKQGFCYGCNIGHFGAACRISCPVACSAQGCKQDDGVCFSCLHGKFGDKCEKDCPTNCIGCSKQSGECLTCKEGYYGPKCLKQCPKNCNNDGCNTLGNCYKCKNGYYGTKCDMMCAKTCAKGICDMNQGRCSSCKIGFFGDRCKRNCPSKCSVNGCDREAGKCIDCVLGFYGNDCNMKCPENCDSNRCSKMSGYCVGCKTGFYGNTCEKVCADDCDSRGCKMSTGECWQKLNNTLSNGHARTSAQVQSDNNRVQLLGPILAIALLNVIIIVVAGILVVYYIQRKRYESNYKRFDDERVNNPTFNWSTSDVSSPDKEASA